MTIGRSTTRSLNVLLCAVATLVITAGCADGLTVGLGGHDHDRTVPEPPGDDRPVTAISDDCPAELTRTPESLAAGAAALGGPRAYEVDLGDLPEGYHLVQQEEFIEAKAIAESVGLAADYDTWTEVLVLARGPWETTEEYATVVVIQAGKAVLCDTLRRKAGESLEPDAQADGGGDTDPAFAHGPPPETDPANPRSRAVEVGDATALLIPRIVPARGIAIDTLMWLAHDDTMLQVNATALSYDEMLRLATGIRLTPVGG